jgi:formate hydrogenlyase subunit 3/multisubunit Na+/H+ antiporter MnhD subunit
MKKTLTALCVAVSVLSTSCLGPCNAFQSTMSWNSRATDNKYLNELIYIPAGFVHGFALFGDVIIFNSIEFWGGENPIAKPAEFKSQGK